MLLIRKSNFVKRSQYIRVKKSPSYEVGQRSGSILLHQAETGFEHKQNYSTLLHSSMLPACCTIRAFDTRISFFLINYEQNNSYLRPERVYDELGHWSGSILLHKAETRFEHKWN